MTAPAPAVSFDPRPLMDPVDRSAARAYAQQLRTEGRVPGASVGSIVVLIATGVFAVVVVSFIATVFTTVLGSFISRQGPLFALIAVVPILVIGGVAALGITLGVRSLGSRRIRWFRLDRFARANGMGYLPSMPAPALPGLIFSQGSDRKSTDLVRGERPRFVEFANYRYTTGSGKEETTHKWGYVAVRLDVPLPNIVLDATSNNGVFGGTNLPAALDRAQRLSLEGDFDRYFTLYCPRGYERDALYLFTPDIMARFIDNAAALDVEIVDDWLFLYARRDLSTLDPATWAWLFSTVSALLDKLAQWARWRDDRLTSDAAAPPSAAPATIRGGGQPASALPFAAPAARLGPPPGVAAEGRRLKRRFPVVTTVVFGAFIVFWLLLQWGVFGSFLSFFRP